MRQIKFRGKRIENDEWVYGALLTSDWNIDGYAVCAIVRSFAYDYNVSTFHVHPETVGQFTGLKDKNGKEIYEGDKIRGFDSINKYTDPALTDREPTYTDSKYVEFINGSFCLSSNKYPNGGCGVLGSYKPNKSEFMELIGNIHQ